MAITQAICTVFKQDLMSPGGNLAAQTLKCALYDNTASLAANTTAYATANEVSSSGTNYTAGGNALTNVAISVDGKTAIFDADNVTFANAIAVLDFGGVKTSTNGTFELQFPTANSTAGLIRIA